MLNGVIREFSLYLGTVTCKLFVIKKNHKLSLYLFVWTHNGGSVDIEQDIWYWNIFPKEVFIAGICWRVLFVSSKHFHSMEGHGIKQWNDMDQFPINCDSIKSLSRKKCLTLIQLFYNLHLSI